MGLHGELYFHYAYKFSHSLTRILTALLGPCFKTGVKASKLPALVIAWFNAQNHPSGYY